MIYLHGAGLVNSSRVVSSDRYSDLSDPRCNVRLLSPRTNDASFLVDKPPYIDVVPC